ncbi:MAG TPA: hypothetical protein VFE62_22395 [Gemmataceae bacterium]|nr:hypothetical protein [Gemmataceae bacterium]
MSAARVLLGMLLFGLACTLMTVDAQEKKKEKNPLEGKMGTAIGTLVGKDKNSIELKADGEEKARKYFPQWKGGLPAKGGGFDKDILKIFNEVKIGSRLEVEWVFHERLRALKVKVLKAPVEKDKDK